MANESEELEWFRVADVDELPPGRVKTVTAGVHSMALTNIEGAYTAMENRCPHQKSATTDSAGCAVPGMAGTLIRKPGCRLVGMKIAASPSSLSRFVTTEFTWVWRQNLPMRRPSPT